MGSTVELHILSVEGGFDPSRIDLILHIFEGRGLPVILSSEAVFDEMHVSFGIMHAARSILKGEARAKDTAMEVLRCMAGTHQISSAIEIIGPERGAGSITVIVLPPEWPTPGDDASPPVVSFKMIDTATEGIREMKEPVFGGPGALEKMGLETSGDIGKDRMRMLEHLSSIEWN